MEKAPAEMMREFVRSQKFTSTDEVMTAMKNMFKDILQEVMECELADELGYEKSERTSNNECSNKSKNYRNGYSKKTIKTQMGELDIKVPRDRNGEYEPKIIGKYNRKLRLINHKSFRIGQSVFVYQIILCKFNRSFNFTDIKKVFGQRVSNVIF